MNCIEEKAYAKINLFLDVVSRRTDGYHDILSFMQNISLHDTVKIQKNANSCIKIASLSEKLPENEKDNLAYKAAEAFFERLSVFDRGVTIEIQKTIPVAAGLAGGSSDAAATLRGLNKLYGKPFSTSELCEIGKKIGADVPFCIVGGAKITTGIGDLLSEADGLKDKFIVLACGEEKVSTPAAYRALDEKFNNFENYESGVGFNELLKSISQNDIKRASKYTFNIFESVMPDSSTIFGIKETLKENNAIVFMMSGSGPSVFGIFENRSDAENAARILMSKNITAHVCEPVNFIENQEN